MIVSRKEALAKGLPRYFSGVLCKRGHLSERNTTKSDCISCLKDRQLSWGRKNAESGNARSRAWYAANKEKAKKTRDEWRKINSEKHKADIKAYQQKNKDRLRLAAAEWQRKNPEKMLAKRQRYFDKNRDRIIRLAAGWRRKNRGYINAKKKRRESIRRKAIPSWADFSTIREIYQEAARLTGLTGIQHHVDHIVPLQSPWVCGLHCEANLQILPYYENQSKSNKTWPDMPDLAGCRPSALAIGV